MPNALAGSAPGTYSGYGTATPDGPSGPGTGVSGWGGITLRGPIDQAVKVTSYGQFTTIFGGPISTSILADCVDVFFREGGTALYIARNVGVGAAVATANLTGSSGVTLIVDAANPGTWANGYTVNVTVTGGTFVLDGYDANGNLVATTGTQSTPAGAVAAWATNAYFRPRLGAGSGNPVAATGTTLTGGTQGATSDTSAANALALFTPDLTLGHIAFPGDTATNRRTQLIAAGLPNSTLTQGRRLPVLDFPDASAATSAAAGQALWATAGADFAIGCVSIGVTPGGPAGSTRQIPGSVFFCALAAASDAAGNVPGVAIAAGRGTSNYATGLVRQFTTAERKLLNDAGLTVMTLDEPNSTGQRRVMIFSDRTISDRTDATKVGESSDARVLMAVDQYMRNAQRPYRFAQIAPQVIAQLTAAQANLGTRMYEKGVIDDAGSGVYTDAFSVQVTADKIARAFTSTAYVRPARCAEVMSVTVIRQLVEG